jgi:hypothetical protein
VMLFGPLLAVGVANPPPSAPGAINLQLKIVSPSSNLSAIYTSFSFPELACIPQRYPDP